ncbi:unnamed protein product [Phytophthora lilii]|uniref:Unnamed protein product n=1 Tax=Phytophthora lilii TaxID=2077276 RepID=A0A9W6U9I1_9STRA|nr:unnamed protein product [Phytophthora lilii]
MVCTEFPPEVHRDNRKWRTARGGEKIVLVRLVASGSSAYRCTIDTIVPRRPCSVAVTTRPASWIADRGELLVDSPPVFWDRTNDKKMGFREFRADPCMFVRIGKSPVYIILYVDDLLVGCKTDPEAEAICTELGSQLKLKSIGDARFVLGMEIQYNIVKGKLLLCQTQFIKHLLEKFGQQDSNAVRNPLIIGQDLTQDGSHEMHRGKLNFGS